MLGLKFEGNTKLRVSRWGTLCGVFAMLVFVTGCPFLPPAPTPCAEDADCDDGLFCNGAETCVEEACVVGEAPCEADYCDEENDVCYECLTDVDCDDADLCTTDACVEHACVATAVDCGDQVCDPATGDCVDCLADTDCDDELYCTGVETCDTDTNECVAGTDPCDPDTEVCIEVSQSCSSVCTTAADCPDDGDVCTVETCTEGVCLTTAFLCDDEDLCTTDTCDSETGCVYTAVVCNEGFECDPATGDCVEVAACETDEDCDDGLFCTGIETCDEDGNCIAGADPCGVGETCDEAAGACMAGETIITLTKEIDTVTGTSVDETIRGAVKAIDSTLDAGDSIDGGGGTDTLEVSLSGGADYAGLADIRRVEDYFVRNANDVGGGNDFSMSGSTDYLKLWSDRSSDPLTFKGMDTLAEVGLFRTDQNLTATYADSALTGTGSTVIVNLNESEFTFNATTDAFTGSTVVVRSATGAAVPANGGPETIVINSIGDAPNGIASIDDAGENDFKTLEIEGDQNLQIDAIGGSVTAVNAAVGGSFTGNLDIDISAADANDITVTLGNGTNTVRAGTTDDDDTITGGTGTDTLIMGGATFDDTDMTGVENLEFDSTGATITFDLDSAPDISQVTIDESGGALTTVTGTNCPDNFTLLLDTSADLIINGASTLTPPATLTGPEAIIDVGGTANHIQFTAAWSIGGFTKLTFDTDVNQVTLNAANLFEGGAANNLATLVFLGGATVNIGSLLNDHANFNTIDAEDADFTGLLNMTAAANSNDLEIKGSAGFDVLVGGAGDDEIDGNDGGDNITGAAGDDDLDGGDGNDTITGGAGADTMVGGDDVDRFIFGATVGDMAGDSITDFGTGVDVIQLAAANTGGATAVFAARADLTAIVAGEIARIAASRTTVQIAADVTGAAQANSVALILDSTLGHAVLVHDTDWADIGNRTVMNITSLTTQVEIDALANGTVMSQ